MQPADASSDPSFSFVEISPSNLRVLRNPVAPGDSPTGSPLLASNTMAFDHTLHPTAMRAKASFAAWGTTAASSQTPFWKRGLDIALIVLSLPLWLPVMIFLAVWVKLASPGPVFFRQERVGFRGKRFMILKFRTMKVNVETQSHERHLEQLIHGNRPMTKLDAAGDPRIIAGGRILRATGLDELPQIFNVLRGEMSLVGPRPCTPIEFARYQGWQQERVNALPGLTGYWQVNGKNKTTFTEMINMDIFYSRNMSLWLDLTIMARTFNALLAQVKETRTASSTRDRASDGARANESVAGQC